MNADGPIVKMQPRVVGSRAGVGRPRYATIALMIGDGSGQTTYTLDVTSHSAEETVHLGEQLGQQLRAGDVVLLYGEFGAGKTHLTKGIALGLGSDDMVNSPSFVLINQYRSGAAHGRAPIYHIDLYRLEDTQALAGIGLDEALEGDGICVIEWAERAVDWLPPDYLAVLLRHTGETDRALRFQPHGSRAAAIVADLRRTVC